MGCLHLEKMLAIPEAKVVGVLDLNRELTSAVAYRHRVPPFNRLADLLFEADCLVIASSTPSHYTLARAALEAGVHVLVEKPLTSTADEALELSRLADRVGRVLQVGHIERVRYQALSQWGVLSRVRFIECHRLASSVGREAGLDVVSDLMIHDLDLALNLIGDEPSSVTAIGMEVITPCVDMANVRLEFPSGAVVNASASRVSAKSLRKFRVFSAHAYASLDFVENSASIYTRDPSGEIRYRKEQVESFDALRTQAELFLRSVREGIPPIATGWDGYRAMRCVELVGQRIRERSATLHLSGAAFDIDDTVWSPA